MVVYKWTLKTDTMESSWVSWVPSYWDVHVPCGADNFLKPSHTFFNWAVNILLDERFWSSTKNCYLSGSSSNLKDSVWPNATTFESLVNGCWRLNSNSMPVFSHCLKVERQIPLFLPLTLFWNGKLFYSNKKILQTTIVLRLWDT